MVMGFRNSGSNDGGGKNNSDGNMYTSNSNNVIH
jgi:hypothetical protein